MDVTLDSGKQVHLTPDQAKHIDYGYAVNSQARADRVLFDVRDPAQLNMNSQLYAALSRVSKDAVLYTSDAAAFTREPAAKIERPAFEKSSFSYGPSLDAAEQQIVFSR